MLLQRWYDWYIYGNKEFGLGIKQFETCQINDYWYDHPALGINASFLRPGVEFHIYLFIIEGLVQECSNSSVLAMELLQSSAEPSISWIVPFHKDFSPCGEQLEHSKLAHEL